MRTLEETRTTSAADAATAPIRELASRMTDGIEVTLLWNRLDSSVSVAMWNRAQGTYLQFHPDPRTARDAFNHPYPYATAAGLRCEEIFLAV